MFALIENEKILYFIESPIDWKECIEVPNYRENLKYIYLDWKIVSNKELLIKEKYQKIIFDKYSLTDQLNMSNEAVQITAVVQFEKRDFTEEETLKLLEIQEAKKWIYEKRKECQDEIIALN